MYNWFDVEVKKNPVKLSVNYITVYYYTDILINLALQHFKKYKLKY